MASNFAIRPLDWDSEFFNKRIAQLDFEKTSSSTQNLEEFELVQAKVLTTDYKCIDKLNKLNFKLVEGELNFVINLEKRPTPSLECKPTIAKLDDIVTIKSIADNTFVASRYRAPWFTKEQRDQFYQLWAEKAVLGTFDDVCLLIKENDTIKGFVTLKITQNSARIGLISVNNQYQGQGIGFSLLQHAEEYCKRMNVSQLFVATQLANKAAISIYSKFGFTINSLSYWFYKTNDPI